MKKLLILLVVSTTPALPALAQSYYQSPDAPTDLAGTTYLPWDLVRVDSGAYTLVTAFPAGAAVDSLHAMCSGQWLLSVEAAVDLPPGSGVFFEPQDVLVYDPAFGTYQPFFCGIAVGIPPGSNVDAAFLRGGDGADLVIGFDAPTDLTALGGGLYDPADLVQFQRVAPGCNGWQWMGTFFDASAAVPPVATSTDATGADRRGSRTMMAFDVPTTLAGTWLPGQVVTWDPGLPGFVTFDAPPWPFDRSSRMDAFSLLPGPGEVPSMHVTKSTITVGDLTVTWVPSTSAGAENYGIYEGSLTTPWTYGHTPATCNDSGSPLTEEITPSSGNRYYLVVALNPDMEGSYGRNSSNVERPQGGSPCRGAQDFDCP